MNKYEQYEKLDGFNEIKAGVEQIFIGLNRGLGLNLKDENFTDTPKRVAKAYFEIFGGVKDTDKQIEEILSSSFPSDGYDQMIVCSGIRAYSMCPHHLLPVEYDVNVGYIPAEDGSVLGVSKLARIVEVLAKQPILQETLTKQIGESLERVRPGGVMVTVSGTHYCMRMRGVKMQAGGITTSYNSGAFRDDAKTREEFLQIIAMGRKF